MMDFTLNMMDFTLKMMDFILKLIRRVQELTAADPYLPTFNFRFK